MNHVDATRNRLSQSPKFNPVLGWALSATKVSATLVVSILGLMEHEMKLL